MSNHTPQKFGLIRIGTAAVLAISLQAQAGFIPQAPFVNIGSATFDPGGQVLLILAYSDGTPNSAAAFVNGSLNYPVGSFLASSQAIGSATCTVRRNPITLLQIGRIDFSVNSGAGGVPLTSRNVCNITFTARTTQPTAAAQPLDLSVTCDDGLPGKTRSGKINVACNAFDGSLTVRQALYGSAPAPGGALAIVTTTTTPRSKTLTVSNSGTFATQVTFSGLAPPLSISPTAVPLSVGASVPVAVTCAATQNGVFNSTLLANITNDATRTQASYAVSCDSKSISQTPLAITWNANDHSRAPSFTADGNRIAFQSRASNLIPVEGDVDEDIFVFDAVSGDVRKVSVDNAGNPITSDTLEPTLSAQGDLVAFVAADAGVGSVQGESKSSRDARRKAAGSSVYMRNLIRNTTQRLSSALPGGATTQPTLAPSGDALVFAAPAVAGEGVPGQINIYRRKLPRSGDQGDRVLGELECVSCKADDPSGRKTTVDASGPSGNPVISADGNFVAWETSANNAVLGEIDPCVVGGATQIILRNMITGASQRMSAASSASQCGSGLGSGKPSLDYSGRRLVFESDVALEPGAANDGHVHIYLVDLNGGATTRLTEVVVPPGMAGSPGDGDSMAPVISGDGESVAFVSAADNLDQSGTEPSTSRQVYMTHLAGRRVERMQRVSRNANGVLGDSDSQDIAMDYSGRRLGYDSDAENLAPAASPSLFDVFVQDSALNVDGLFQSGFE